MPFFFGILIEKYISGNAIRKKKFPGFCKYPENKYLAPIKQTKNRYAYRSHIYSETNKIKE